MLYLCDGLLDEGSEGADGGEKMVREGKAGLQVLRVVVADPVVSVYVLPRQRLEWKVDGRERGGEHDRRTALWIPEDEQLSWKHLKSDLFGFGALIDPCEDFNILCAKDSFQPAYCLCD